MRWYMLALALLVFTAPHADAASFIHQSPAKIPHLAGSPAMVQVAWDTPEPGQLLQASIPVPANDRIDWWVTGANGTFPLLASHSPAFNQDLPLALPPGIYTLMARDESTGRRFQAPLSVMLGSIFHIHSGSDPFSVYQQQNILPLLDSGVDGQGETIGVYAESLVSSSDIAAFDAEYGLPPLSMDVVTPDGTLPPEGASNALTNEATMDAEWAHAIAPDAAIALYVYPQTANGMGQAAILASASGDTAFSISFAGPAIYNTALVSTQLAQAAATGMAIFVSSGDSGESSVPFWPASSPAVVTVGGIEYTAMGTTYWQQPGMSGGYGTAQRVPAPGWQSAVTGQTARMYPDVSMPAAYAPVVIGGEPETASGTSLATPGWAGIWALVGQYRADTGGANLTAPAGLIIYLAANTPGVFPQGRFTPQTGWGAPDVWRLAQSVAGMR